MIRNLLKLDPQLQNLYKMPPAKLQQFLQIHSSKMEKFKYEFHSINVHKLTKLYNSKNISYITFHDSDYPQVLQEIHDPPLVLFFKGNKNLLTKHAIAIVGARAANKYAQTALDLILPELIRNNIVIVSGLAKGTDTFAHEKTIESGGKTIAVLGGGFFHLYPPENKALAAEIEKNHLLLSEYAPIIKPERWHFPMRNRIISGLAKGTIVVQAKKRSGSLITADMALEAGREVFAFPGPINDSLSEGTNHLIQQGAKLITSGNDILEEIILE
ncbi:DNA-processing protein DprA [Bacillus sp. FJAT-49870]|uniref:DNA-processing protein DprA n=2 Tax=Lederbergia citri TaxID=2833580 RepID=A0A942YH05_9BACI|nr:DNA-processing protein DprA [Lederbergia citri]